MRRTIPWIDLAIGVAAPGAGLLLLAIGIADEGPMTFMGWRTLVLALPAVLLARPSATAWRDALPGGAAAVFALGMLGYALEAADVASVAIVTIGVAFGAAPLVFAASCPRLPSVLESVGAFLGAAAVVLLGSTDGFSAGLWLAAAAGVGFAGVVVLTDRVIEDHPAPSIVTAEAFVAAVALVVAGGLLDGRWLPDTESVPLLLVAGLATGLAPLLARWRGVEVLGATMARRVLPLEMAVAVAVSVWVAGTAPTPAVWAATGLALVGSVVAGWQPGRLVGAEAFGLGR